MAFVIVNSTNAKVEKKLQSWFQQDLPDKVSEFNNYISKFFVRKLGPGTYLMRGNGAVLALLYNLKAKHNGNIYIFISESLDVENEFPQNVVEVVKECQKKKRSLKLSDLKKLETLRLDYSGKWNRESFL